MEVHLVGDLLMEDHERRFLIDQVKNNLRILFSPNFEKALQVVHEAMLRDPDPPPGWLEQKLGDQTCEALHRAIDRVSEDRTFARWIENRASLFEAMTAMACLSRLTVFLRDTPDDHDLFVKIVASLRADPSASNACAVGLALLARDASTPWLRLTES